MRDDGKRYVLVLDRDRDFVRIFRADSEARPQGDVLWEGDGLRSAYDAMIRVNRDRRPSTVYRLCREDSRRRLARYRIFDREPDRGWIQVSTHHTRKSAAAARREAESLDLAEAERREGEFDRRLAAHGVSRRVSERPTGADFRYLAWIEARDLKKLGGGRLSIDEVPN